MVKKRRHTAQDKQSNAVGYFKDGAAAIIDVWDKGDALQPVEKNDFPLWCSWPVKKPAPENDSRTILKRKAKSANLESKVIFDSQREIG